MEERLNRIGRSQFHNLHLHEGSDLNRLVNDQILTQPDRKFPDITVLGKKFRVVTREAAVYTQENHETTDDSQLIQARDMLVVAL